MRSVVLYIDHIVASLRRILEYTGDGRDAFLADPKTQDAVLRNFMVVGEAAKRLPQTFRDEWPDIPWRRIAGFRDILVHQYEHVDLNEVWLVVERDCDELRGSLERILATLEASDKGGS